MYTYGITRITSYPTPTSDLILRTIFSLQEVSLLKVNPSEKSHNLMTTLITSSFCDLLRYTVSRYHCQ
ncbi:hypothetical protein M378DRAFT_172339 [Amanita muscaria Koide BX008]|uniref:Uncharacterized protein n=1 Tax=Amanita muscaria (strain Koide BX008) TaxID=946122 RepID=A0A0C2W6N8_AMAMK|nr:hypothetical protein M378DRAFT_172339 [Amanita muscaria Koide BX008]